MKKLIGTIALATLLGGCVTTLESVQNTKCDAILNVDDVVYNSTTGFKVFQILSDGTVLASHPGYIRYVINGNTGIRADIGKESFLDIHVIPLQTDYVDGQALRVGYYKYIGNYKYTTVEKKERTIRQFLEVLDMNGREEKKNLDRWRKISLRLVIR